jgi:hypothetical protein
MVDSIASSQKLPDSLILYVESTKAEIISTNIRLWDAPYFPDICSWPTAREAKFTGFSLADEKWGLLYAYSLSAPENRKRGNRACSPLNQGSPLRSDPFLRSRSGRDFGLDFIHPLVKKADLVSSGKQGLFIIGSSNLV